MAINGLIPMESLALLFKCDTIHGIWPEDVELDGNRWRLCNLTLLQRAHLRYSGLRGD